MFLIHCIRSPSPGTHNLTVAREVCRISNSKNASLLLVLRMLKVEQCCSGTIAMGLSLCGLWKRKRNSPCSRANLLTHPDPSPIIPSNESPIEVLPTMDIYKEGNEKGMMMRVLLVLLVNLYLPLFYETPSRTRLWSRSLEFYLCLPAPFPCMCIACPKRLLSCFSIRTSLRQAGCIGQPRHCSRCRLHTLLSL